MHTIASGQELLEAGEECAVHGVLIVVLVPEKKPSIP